MEITSHFINIPPLLSVSWHQIASLHMEEELLVVTLVSGSAIEVPNLPTELIQRIFNAHAFYLRNLSFRSPASVQPTPSPASKEHAAIATSIPPIDSPSDQIAGIRFGFTTLDGMGSTLQHNPAMANAPDIPKEILSKIAAVSKILAPGEAEVLPRAEQDCNCMHCQIMRTIHEELEASNADAEVKQTEENVSDEELTFQQWNIVQTGDKLFSVINRLDPSEQYHVYLGQPVGCTCGRESCEHIVAVLKS